MPPKTTECVKVIVRTRPMNQKEFDRGCSRIVQTDSQSQQVHLFKPGEQNSSLPRTFTFDVVYGEDSNQQQVYDETGFSLVESVLEGYNGTMFAYGQTGCGKTHTMMGPASSLDEKALNQEERGIIPRTVRHIFGFIDAAEKGIKFLVRCSYLEIYNESILDLLSKSNQQNLQIKEDPNKGIYVKDLTTVIVKSVPELEKILYAGMKNRKTGETAMNKDSSRSHSIFTIYIETAEDIKDGTGKQKIKAGKLNLVDLAGSERQSKTQATGARLDEAKNINLSLSALGNVIKALVDGVSTHVPYRDSKLTRLLQDSLGGNTKTVMIAALSPADYNYDETLSTLHYANRAKQIKNKPTINEDPKDALLKEYENEIKQLRAMLAQMQSQGASGQQMNQAIQMLQNNMKNQNQGGFIVEDSVDVLIKKLEGQGKRIKIIEDGDDEENEDEAGEKRRKKAKSKNRRRENDDEDEDQTGGNEHPQNHIIQQKLKELEDLEKEKLNIHADKERIQSELQAKEERLRIEAQEKEKLEQMLVELETKLVSGGQALEEKEKEQSMVYREYQKKLKQQRKKQKKLLDEKRQKEEEILNAEKQYQSLQDEVNDQRVVIEKLKQKYQGALQEIKDIQQEQQGDREELLDTIRQQELDLKFYKKLVKMLMKNEEIAKLKLKSQYDDNLNDWQIPPFILRAKEVTLPSLKKNAYDVMEQEKENRDLSIDDDDDSDSEETTFKNQYDQRNQSKLGIIKNGKSKSQHQRQPQNYMNEYADRPNRQNQQQQQQQNFNNSISNQQAPQASNITTAKRVQSRGRIQINAQNKNSTQIAQNVPMQMRWSQIDTSAMNNSEYQNNNNSQSHLSMLMSPEPSIMSKNQKAMAQLAPLGKPSVVANANTSTSNNINNSKMNIPSIDQLQGQLKLQPLNHIPKKKQL